jgi:hypothetical protein
MLKYKNKLAFEQPTTDICQIQKKYIISGVFLQRQK